MHRWSVLLVFLAAVVGCNSATRTPTLAPAPAPTTIPSAVLEPTETPTLESTETPILEPTETPPSTPATGTPEASATQASTQAPTVRPVRAASPTTGAQYKYQAPAPLGPSRPTMYKNGGDIPFTYASVGPLAANQCYLLHVEMVNPNFNPGNRGDDFLDKDHCGDLSATGKRLLFTLYRGSYRAAPNYGTILSEALALAPLSPSQLLKVTWYVRLVQNNGLSADQVHYQVVPLSLPSAVLDFDFEPPG
jgi:hypothetical protein